MGKFWVEICLISARGLTRTSSLWKLQWFAVGWIDPNNKYCSKVDASGNANPRWKTKFWALVDDSESRFEDLTLSIEVYSRDPVFLKERLQGTASIGLKEFLDKHNTSFQGWKNVEEVGSFQLRKRNSNKPQGFVDVSVRTSQEMNELEDISYEGNDVGIKLRIHDHGVNLPSHSENHLPPGPNYHQPRPTPPPNYAITGGSNNQPSYHQPLSQPPPPPPYNNLGYGPSSSKDPGYMNMPPLSGARPGPGLAMGLGAGALAAGAAIFGDDFVSGFDLPTGFKISTDPSY